MIKGKVNQGSDNTLSAGATERIVGVLFPEQPIRKHPAEATPREEVPLFCKDDIDRAIKTIKNGKVPRLDGIVAEVLKRAVKVIPGILLSMFNACSLASVFPRE